MFSHDVVILMTGTIDPGPYSGQITRNTIDERLADYLGALQFWAAFPDERLIGIVFCENSGYAFERFKLSAEHAKRNQSPTALRKEVELLSFSGNHKPNGVHYGYSELGIIDYAIDNSELIKKSDYFIKATGRLTFPGIKTLLNTLEGNIGVALDCRRSYRKETGVRIRARSQLALFKRSFYCELLYGRRDEMIGHCFHIEEWLAEKLFPFRNEADIYLRWPVECNPCGVDGYLSESYRSKKNLAKIFVRRAMRRLVPSVWL